MKARIVKSMSFKDIPVKDYLKEIIDRISNNSSAMNYATDDAIYVCNPYNKFVMEEQIRSRVYGADNYISLLLADAHRMTVMLAIAIKGHGPDEVIPLLDKLTELLRASVDETYPEYLDQVNVSRLVLDYIQESDMLLTLCAAYADQTITPSGEMLDGLIYTIIQIFYTIFLLLLNYNKCGKAIEPKLMSLLVCYSYTEETPYGFKVATKYVMPSGCRNIENGVFLPFKHPIANALKDICIYPQRNGNALSYSKKDFLAFFLPNYHLLKTNALSKQYKQYKHCYDTWLKYSHEIISTMTVYLQEHAKGSDTYERLRDEEERARTAKLVAERDNLQQEVKKLSRNLHNERSKQPLIVTQTKEVVREVKVSDNEIDTLRQHNAKQAAYIGSLESELASLREYKKLADKLASENADLKEYIAAMEEPDEEDTVDSDEFTAEELAILSTIRAHIMVPDFPSLRELYKYLPNSEIVFMHERFSASFQMGTGKDIYILCTRMCSHSVFSKWKGIVRNKTWALVSQPGLKTICRKLLELQKEVH